jgi:ATP/ADP translocase
VVSDTFTFASANRLMPVIGAAGFLGRILGNKLGGESGHALVSYGLQTADVLWITTAVLGMGAWALWQVNRRGKGLLGMAQRSGENASRPSVREILQQAPRFVRDVRIFRLLAILVFISSISFFLILFEFLSRSRAAYPSNLDFQSFYGNVQAVLQVVIVGLQLFVANRLSRGGELPACRWGCRWS